MIAGASMNMAAGVGTAATTTMRTRRFLKAVNREYFAPRGLKASICKNRQLEEKLGCNMQMPSSADLGSSSQPQTAGYRRLQALTPYIAPLSFNVPSPIEQRSALDRMAAKQIERRIKKKEEKGYSSDSSSSSEPSISSNEESALVSHDEVSGKQKRRADKAERKRAKNEEKKARKKERRSQKQDRKGAKAHVKEGKKLEKEQKMVEKMEYIIIESLNEGM
ncbi:hypothetical protein J4E93_005379 [Alternaria ventricosa]|uniref:uncharacterized protein n=1 Tax=Alternaria ventricosa TaxID=1187951 RepID=UPI0020C294EE|nr:uncharacterized protein J4E93_005379 [Alternaria ventricosa]KAI4645801.1 hypothetical protein J4E93_005379 [Alternaria ventricosa]